MKIGFVKVFVTDLEKSLEFYTKTLGMELDFTDERHWAQFKSGEDVSLAIEKCDAGHVVQGSNVVGRFVGVTFMVDDIAETYEHLVGRGVHFTGPPEKQHWGGTLAHFKDLDGNVLTLMQEAP
jgi:lactoylglutathione lyase